VDIKTREDVVSVLNMPFDEFEKTVKKQAFYTLIESKKNKVLVSGMIAYDNICKNWCTYCGMRAGNNKLKRYRLSLNDIFDIENQIKKAGLHSVFLISGEDPKYDFNDILKMVRHAKDIGLFVILAAGEQSLDGFKALKEAGLDEYALKYETQNRELFNKIKPSTTFDKRMEAIYNVKEAGLKLGSGSIVDFPHQTIENIADDIMLAYELKINWAPIIPYIPVPGTPLAGEGKAGNIFIMQKVISILRIMLPDVNITAQQPGEDLRKGLGDFEGNKNAILAGANVLFADMTPKEDKENFAVINNRMLNEVERIDDIIKSVGMERQ
jgi:biotin synthase